MSTEGGPKNVSITPSPEVSKKPPLSCAECRRLKLKCNRVWPCSSCQKRGLAELCPSGSLATRPRQKPPPPTPQHVVERIHELQGRVNQLEAALATLQSTVSSEPHPLLINETQPYLQKKLMRKAALEKAQRHNIEDFDMADSPTKASSSREEYDETDDVVASLGTLKIAPDGRSTFFGPTAVSEGLSIEEPMPSSSSAGQTISLPVDIVVLSQSFPFATASAALTALQERAKSHIPPIERAETLCASFFAYASFVLNTVPEDEWFETLFSRLYGTQRSCGRSSESPPQDGQGVAHQWHLVPPEELSLFFCILALGALTDPLTEPFSAEAEIYYHLSRALLTTENVLTEPTLASVQTACLASYYEGLQSKSNSSRDCWILMALSNKTAQIMGLHRDHSMFGLDEREIQKRRLIFWEAHSMDTIQSLAMGRPISTPCNYMDTRMPVDTHATTGLTGEIEESFYQWKYRFCAEAFTIVSDHVLRVKPLNYTQTLETDRRMRRFTSTFGRGHPEAQNWSSPKTAAQIQMMLGTRETCMLYIHRGFFAHAVSTEPLQPEKSKYGRSVLAAYESACIIVQGMQCFVANHAKFAARIWFLWNHLMSASFVLGSIVTRAPGCSLASTAAEQLDVVGQILKQAASYGGRAEYMLPVINALRTKGHNARMEYRGGSLNRSPSFLAGVPEDNDELAVIGGKTRLVISRQSSLSPPEAPSLIHDTTTEASTPPESVHLAHALEPMQPISESYGNLYPTYPLNVSSSPGQRQSSYWQQGDIITHQSSGPDLTGSHFAYPVGNDHMLMGYPQLQQQQLQQQDYSTHEADTPASMEGTSNLWQTLVRDLGVGGL